MNIPETIVANDSKHAQAFNDYLKTIDLNYREVLINIVLNGFCRECYDIKEGICYCSYDD